LVLRQRKTRKQTFALLATLTGEQSKFLSDDDLVDIIPSKVPAAYVITDHR